MTKGLLLSKLFEPQKIAESLSFGNVRNLSGRCSGDTTGYVFVKLGRLMMKTAPYTLTSKEIQEETGCSLGYAHDILDSVMYTANQTKGLKFFERVNKDTIKYDPWY